MENTNTANHKLVMLVDDSTIDNFVNQKIIERYGFSEKVISFTKAQKALDLLSELDSNPDNLDLIPSVIFLDLIMPVMDGVQFTIAYEKLSDKIKSRCHIVFLSSSMNTVDITKYKESKNVLAYLCKPLIKHDLEYIDQLVKVSEIKMNRSV